MLIIIIEDTSPTKLNNSPSKQNKPPKGPKRNRTLQRENKHRLSTIDNNIPLLEKWEKEYGGIKDRQFYVQDDHDYDEWYTHDSQNNPQVSNIFSNKYLD